MTGPVKDKLMKKVTSYIYPRLRKEPHFGNNIKKLKSWNPETWRYRLGDFRLFYEIDETEKIVFIITLVPRSKAY